MAQDPERSAGGQLMSLVERRAESPRPEVRQRGHHEDRADGDDDRAGDSLARKPERHSLPLNCVEDAEIHHTEGDHVKGKERTRKASGVLLFGYGRRRSSFRSTPVAQLQDQQRDTKRRPEKIVDGVQESVRILHHASRDREYQETSWMAT